MKRILYFLVFLATATQAQVLDGTLRNRAIVIRDETIAGRNTPYRVGSLFLNLVESKTNLIQGVTALGTNDYSVTISSAVTTYIDGLELTIKIGNANTTASTLNVNALGAKAIVDVASGDLEAGKYYKLVYNGTAFQLVGGLGGSDIADITGLQDSLSAKQPLDSDLTSISGLSPTNDDVLQRKAGVWTNRSIAQLKVDEAINNIDNTSDANKPVSTATQTALDAKQTLDSDLTSIAGLIPTNDDIIQRKAGAWINRTISQVKTDLAISNVDNTSDASKPVSTAQQTAIDGKVAQTITDGVTTSAPSQDAVFDSFSTVPIVSVTGTTTLDATAFGKIHIFSGTSADYTVNLLTAVGNTGKSITFKGSPSLTKIVTLDASGSQTIDLALTKTLVTSESFTLISDGSVWLQVGNSYGTWYSYTPSYTGFSVAPTNNASRYTVIGKTLIAFIGSSTNGTSNATTFTITLPIAVSSTFAHVISVNVMYINNGSGGATPGYAAGAAGSNVLTIYRDFNATAWTASGAKNAFINIIYEID